MKKTRNSAFILLLVFLFAISGTAGASSIVENGVIIEVPTGGSSSGGGRPNTGGGGGSSGGGGSGGGIMISPPNGFTIPETAYTIGDIDLNQQVDHRDAELLIEFIGEIRELSSLQLLLGDVNSDGKINENDVMWILRFSQGLPLRNDIKAGAPLNKLTISKIQAKDAVFNGNILSYYPTNSEVDYKTTNVKVSNNFRVLVNSYFSNGDLQSIYNNNDFVYLDLLDFNNDSYYDYVLVTQYYPAYVSSLNLETKTVTVGVGSPSAPQEIILDGSLPFSLADYWGETIEIDHLKKGDVLNVFTQKRPNETDFLNIVVTSYKISGMVEEQTANKLYTIEEGKYYSYENLSVGFVGNFYVDLFGMIVKAEKDLSDKKMGMLYHAYVSNVGLETNLMLSFFTSEGNIINRALTKYVILNNRSYRSEQITSSVSDGGINLQDFTLSLGELFVYSDDSYGDIKEISTGDYISQNTENQYQKTPNTISATFQKYSGRLGDFTLTWDSNLLANEAAEGTYFTKDQVSPISTSMLNEREDYSYQAIYNEEMEILFAVFYDYRVSVDPASSVMFVTDVASSYSSLGDPQTILTGIVNGKSLNLIISVNTHCEDAIGNAIDSEFMPGDVLQFLGGEETRAIRMILTADQMKYFTNENNGLQIGNEEDNTTGFLYGGQAQFIKNGNIEFGNKMVRYPLEVPTMLVRIPQNQSYVTGVNLGLAETNQLHYNGNDDTVLIYKFDGKAKFAVIVDHDGESGYFEKEAPITSDGILTILADQAKGGILNPDDGFLLYYENGIEHDLAFTKAYLSDTVKAFINESTVESDIDDLISGYKAGQFPKITLIDQNRDGVYEEIRASKYYALSVGEIRAEVYRIIADEKTPNAPNSLFLDPLDIAEPFRLNTVDGKELNFSDIQLGDILNAFESRLENDTIHRKIILTKNKISGMVTEKTIKDLYKINNTYYTSIKELNIGDQGDFHTDLFGNVLRFSEDKNNNIFGIVYAAYYDTNGLDNNAKIILYTTEGQFNTYEFQNNIRIDESFYNKDDLDITSDNEIQLLYDRLITPGDLVLIKKNTLGKIREIYSPNYINVGTAGKYKHLAYNQDCTFRESNQRLGSGYVTEDSVLVGNERSLDESFHRESLSLIPHNWLNEDDTYNFQAIIDQDKYIVFGVIYDFIPKVKKSDPVMFVTEVNDTLDSDGDHAYFLTGMMNGEEASILVTQETAITNAQGEWDDVEFQKGDLIQFGGNEEAHALRVLLTADQIKAYTNEKDGFFNLDQEEMIFGGKVLSIRNGIIEFEEQKISFAENIPTMLVRPELNKFYAKGTSFALAETDQGSVNGNDDQVILYQYDGIVLAAVIVDLDGDTGYIIKESPVSPNGILTITDKQAKDGVVNFNKGTLFYYSQDSNTDLGPVQAKLSNGVKFFINENELTYSTADFAEAYGNGQYEKVILTDTNGDQLYDEIRAIEYYSLCVGEVNSNAYQIFAQGKTPNAPDTVTLNPQDSNAPYTLEAEDKAALSFSDIQQGDILTVFESKITAGKTQRKIILTRNTMYGTVTMRNSEGQYRIKDSYFHAPSIALNIGDKGTFSFDPYGNILKFVVEAEIKFGVLYAAYIENIGLDSIPKAMIYNDQGQYETYSFSKNVRINDEIYWSYDLYFYQILSEHIKNGDLVLFRANSAGEITELYNGAFVNAAMNGEYKVEYIQGIAFNKAKMKLGEYSIKENTIIVSNKRIYEEKFNKSDLSLIDSSLLSVIDSYNIQIITDWQNNIILTMIYDFTIKVDPASPIVFVTSRGSAMDSEGRDAILLLGVVGEEPVYITVTEDTNIESPRGAMDAQDLSKGDMIQYLGDGDAKSVRVLLRAEEILSYRNETHGLNTNDESNGVEGFLYGGKVADIKGSIIQFYDKDVSCSISVPTMLIRNERIYIHRIAVDMAETDESNYFSNDDIVILYKHDGVSLAAIIVDQEEDTRF